MEKELFRKLDIVETIHENEFSCVDPSGCLPFLTTFSGVVRFFLSFSTVYVQMCEQEHLMRGFILHLICVMSLDMTEKQNYAQE